MACIVYKKENIYNLIYFKLVRQCFSCHRFDLTCIILLELECELKCCDVTLNRTSTYTYIDEQARKRLHAVLRIHIFRVYLV